MRCKPFDEQTRAALRKLGFAISDDGESVKITDEMTVEIIWPDHSKAWDGNEFLLTIELPNGMELSCQTWGDQLLHAAGIEEDEAA
jgi:hypothetical protein